MSKRRPRRTHHGGQVHDAVDAVVEHDAIGTDSGTKSRVHGGVENEDREIGLKKRLDGFERRRVGEVEGDEAIDALRLEVGDGAVELIGDATDRRPNYLDAIGLEALHDSVEEWLEVGATLGLGVVVEFQVKGQKPGAGSVGHRVFSFLGARSCTAPVARGSP